jgi:hypothetical protein
MTELEALLEARDGLESGELSVGSQRLRWDAEGLKLEVEQETLWCIEWPQLSVMLSQLAEDGAKRTDARLGVELRGRTAGEDEVSGLAVATSGDWQSVHLAATPNAASRPLVEVLARASKHFETVALDALLDLLKAAELGGARLQAPDAKTEHERPTFRESGAALRLGLGAALLVLVAVLMGWLRFVFGIPMLLLSFSALFLLELHPSFRTHPAFRLGQTAVLYGGLFVVAMGHSLLGSYLSYALIAAIGMIQLSAALRSYRSVEFSEEGLLVKRFRGESFIAWSERLRIEMLLKERAAQGLQQDPWKTMLQKRMQGQSTLAELREWLRSASTPAPRPKLAYLMLGAASAIYGFNSASSTWDLLQSLELQDRIRFLPWLAFAYAAYFLLEYLIQFAASRPKPAPAPR